LKTLLLGEEDKASEARHLAALNAVRQLHRDIAKRVVEDQLSGIIRTVSDGELLRVIRLLHAIPSLETVLQDDVQVRLQNYVSNPSTDDLIPCIHHALDIKLLRTQALVHLSTIKSAELSGLMDISLKKDYVGRAVELYTTSGSWDSANYRAAKLIIPLVGLLGEAEIETIIEAAEQNSELNGSHQLGRVFQRIRESEKLPKESFDELLSKHGFDRYIPDTSFEFEADDIPF
jgi:hypothetical protein